MRDFHFCRNLSWQSQNWGQNLSEKSNYLKSWPIVHLFSRPSNSLLLNYLLRRRISFNHQRSIRIQQDFEYIFKMFTTVCEHIHLKPLETELFITTSNEVYSRCFLTFQTVRCLSWLFVLPWACGLLLCAQGIRIEIFSMMQDSLTWTRCVCDVLGSNISMVGEGGKSHWGSALSAEEYGVVVAVFLGILLYYAWEAFNSTMLDVFLIKSLL